MQRLDTAAEKKKPKPAEEKGKDFSLPSKPKGDIRGGSVAMSKEKKLDDRMKVDLLKDKTKEEIAEIWREYHSKRDSVAAVIPKEMFDQMQERFQEYKTVNKKIELRSIL